jgi:hypothetical protein
MSAAARFNEVAQSRGWSIVCDDRLAFDTPKMKEALSYWTARAGNRAMPQRTDLSPHGMKSFLSLVSMAERDRLPDGTSRWRVRLQGSDLDRIIGPMTGRYMDEVIEGETLKRWVTTIEVVIETGRPMRFVSETPMPDREPIVMDSLLAPLSSNGSDFDMMFNVTAIRPHESWAKLKQIALAAAVA